MSVVVLPKRPSRVVRRLVIWGVTFLGTAALLAASVASIVRFRPYTLLEYAIAPTVACPLELTEVSYSAVIRKPPLGRVTSIRTYSRWVNAEDGRRLEVQTDIVAFNGRYGHRDGISRFTRAAPNEPGLWRIEASIVTEGYQMLRVQRQAVGDLETAPVKTEPVRVRRCP